MKAEQAPWMHGCAGVVMDAIGRHSRKATIPIVGPPSVPRCLVRHDYYHYYDYYYDYDCVYFVLLLDLLKIQQLPKNGSSNEIAEKYESAQRT